jgi:hypothetical protein
MWLSTGGEGKIIVFLIYYQKTTRDEDDLQRESGQVSLLGGSGG